MLPRATWLIVLPLMLTPPGVYAQLSGHNTRGLGVWTYKAFVGTTVYLYDGLRVFTQAPITPS